MDKEKRLKELQEIGLLYLTEGQMEEYNELINCTQQENNSLKADEWDIVPHSLEIFNSLPMSMRCGTRKRNIKKLIQ